MINASALHDAIAAVCPIVSVQIGNLNDRTTWVIVYAPSATAAQQQAGQQILASFVEPVWLTFLQFIALFTAAEQSAIVAAADPQTRLFTMMAIGAGGIDLSNSQVIAGVNYLATATNATPPGPGLITAARAAQILANQPPAT
jgi:hypothetical protein